MHVFAICSRATTAYSMLAIKGVVLLLALAANHAVGESLYTRPNSLSADCLPVTATATTFSSVFPSKFFLSGDDSMDSEGVTTVTVAQNFAVKYYSQYKEVTNTLVNETYILYQCGGKPPSGSVTEGKRVFQIPLTSVMVTDTVPYAFLEILNLTDRVQSVNTFTVAACAQKALACNRSAVEASTLGNTTVLDAKVLPVADGVLVTTTVDPLPPTSAPIFTFSASQDPGTLNRAEWIKFTGLFFNKEKEASNYFDTLSKRYKSIKANAAGTANKPVVAWINHYVYASDEYYQIFFAPYKTQYVQDAGAESLSSTKVAAEQGVTVDAQSADTFDFAWNGTQKGFGTQAEAQAAFLKVLSEVDIVIDENYAVDPASYNLSAFISAYNISTSQAAELSFLNGTNPLVLRTDGLISGSNGLDWYEGAIAKPADVLQDLSSALAAPSDKNRSFVWFRNIQQAPVVVSDAQCTTQPSCTVAPVPICPLVKQCSDGTTVNILKLGDCEYEPCAAAVASAPQPSASDASGPSTLSTWVAAAAAVVIFSAI